MHKTTLPCGGTDTSSHPPPPQPQILSNPKNDVVFPPTLEPYHLHRRGHEPPSCMVTRAAAAASSWLRHRRIRYFFLVLCSPLLLLVVCAALPFLCAAELCLRRRGSLWGKLLRRGDAADRLRRCEEGCCEEEREEEKGLLHRYLEDQLLLVGSMYECGEEEEEEDSRKVEDIERIESVSYLGLGNLIVYTINANG
ncbi:hypothetical protein JHK87_027299 [Glycine soja]|nr:hypothetical protein JHK87_027299 [Glycine soja]